MSRERSPKSVRGPSPSGSRTHDNRKPSRRPKVRKSPSYEAPQSSHYTKRKKEKKSHLEPRQASGEHTTPPKLPTDRPAGADDDATGDSDDRDENDPVRLREKIERLRAELEYARSVHPVPDVPPARPTMPTMPSYKPMTFHWIVDLGRQEERPYLQEPQWVHGDGIVPQLEAYGSVKSEQYLEQHPEVAFVIDKSYDPRLPADLSKIETTYGVLRKAEPSTESVRIVADQMLEALANFVDKVPGFHRMFPKFDPARAIRAPYLFAYYSMDYAEDICLDLERLHATLIRLLMNTIDQNYGAQYIKAQLKARQGLVSKELMLYLVKPGDILVRLDGLETRAFKATSWLEPCQSESLGKTDKEKAETYEDPRGPVRQNRGQKYSVKKIMHKFTVEMWTYSFDGVFEMTRVGRDRAGDKEPHTINVIAEYEDDEVRIDSLNLFPLSYARPEVLEMLAQRGRMFWKCCFRRLVTHQHDPDSYLTNINDRYMIDIVNCRKLFRNPNLHKNIRDDLDPRAMALDEPPVAHGHLLFPPTVIGYNLRTKKLCTLFVDKLRDVNWDKKAFEYLVVERQTKELIQALVMNQLEAEQTTDPISGKGGGLIMLLHGGPGTGKTFTAEGVAEFAEKPLLRVTCGDVGVEPRQVERYLQRCFQLGKIWDCVVLLDEADVFLEERDVKTLQRNALVSVFLRTLEYYQGILILTSNRVGTFDEAFKSRIQLALHYENLTKPQRRKIWRNFMDRLRWLDSTNIEFTDIIDHVEELGKRDMNGREIRNVLTTARQLAKYKGHKLCYDHLKHATEVGGKFSKYLKDLNGGDTDDQIKRESLIR